MKTVLSIAIVLSLGGVAVHATAQGVGKQSDPYTQGAKAGDKVDPYTQGAKVGDKFDPYSQGANKDTREDLSQDQNESTKPAKPAKATKSPGHTNQPKDDAAAKPGY
jgi:hypothetical protein